MKNKLLIFFYVICIIGLSIEIFKSGISNVSIYQILLVLTSIWILFNKVKSVLKEKGTENQ